MSIKQDAERLALFHRRDLGLAEKLIERTAIWQIGERVCLGAFLRFVQGVADRIQLSRRLGEALLQLRRPIDGLGQLVQQIFDQRRWIDPDFTPLGDIADRHHLRPVIGDGRVQVLLGGGHDRMELLRDVVDVRVVAGIGSDIQGEQVAIGGGVELSLVSDQNVDGPLEIGRGAEGIFEPGVKVVRRRWHTMLRHRAHGFFRDRRGVFEIKFVERVPGHDLK